MASGTIASCQTDGETMETVTEFIFWAPKSWQMVTTAMKLKDTCHWKKRYGKPRQSIKKQQHNFATKVYIVKTMVFPVVMYGCESWTI